MNVRVSGHAVLQSLTVEECTGSSTRIVRFSLSEFVINWEAKVVARDPWYSKAEGVLVPICMLAVGILDDG